MIISQEQQELLSKFRSERIRDVGAMVVQTIKGAVIGGQETTLAQLFKGRQNTVDDVKGLWASYGLPKRMGETLFWQCVVDKIEEICKRVGCQYLYLFAADNKPDGNLVSYYNTRLHFEKDFDLNANKPHFDFKCRFMCQEIEVLRQNKAHFFEHFNSKEK